MPSWDQSQGHLTLEHSLSTHSNDRNLTFGKTLPLQRSYFSLVCITYSENVCQGSTILSLRH